MYDLVLKMFVTFVNQVKMIHVTHVEEFSGAWLQGELGASDQILTKIYQKVAFLY